MMTTPSAKPPPDKATLLTYLQASEYGSADYAGSRKHQILEAATDLLREGGFEGFSMRRVADRAGLTLAALQYHFATRADLVRDLIEHRLGWYGAQLAEHLAALPDRPDDLLLGVVDWLIDDLETEPTASFTVQFWAFAAYDPAARAMLDSFMARYRAFLALLIRGVSPTLAQDEALARGAALSILIDGLVLLIAPGKPRHAEFSRLREIVRTTARRFAQA